LHLKKLHTCLCTLFRIKNLLLQAVFPLSMSNANGLSSFRDSGL
jgi:hypothetical protein